MSPTRVGEVEPAVVAVLLALTPGEVVTYGGVAADAGHPRQSRLVGHLLAARSEALGLPWWRVVNATGRLVPGAEAAQAALLRAEGVLVEGGRVRRAPVGRFSRPAGRP